MESEDTGPENDFSSEDEGVDWDEVEEARTRTNTVFSYYGSRDMESAESESDHQGLRLETMPLFAGAQITFGESMLMIMACALNYHFSSDALTSLLVLIGLHCHRDSLFTTSRHAFNKFFSLKNLEFPVKKWKVCICLQINDSNSTICTNALCGKDISKADTLYFLEMPILDQLQNMCKRKGFCKEIRSRFERQRKGQNTIEDITDGHQYRKIEDLKDPNNMSLLMNTDGVRVFKSSNYGIWPVYFTVNELPYRQRTKRENCIFAGVFFGFTKPPMIAFMEPFAKALASLQRGVEVHPPNEDSYIAKVFLIGCTADLQAKALLMNMKQHNGNFGCPKCEQKGEHKAYKHQYKYQSNNPKGPRRTHQGTKAHVAAAMDSTQAVFGIKGPSWLTTVPHFDLIEGMAIDYMHGVLLGVTKKLIHFWFDETAKNKGKPWYCGRRKAEVDNMLESIKPPMEVHRRPRSISTHLQHWKASEFRAWLLYYSLPVMVNILPERYYEHYTLLVMAIHTLLQSSITTEDLDRAEAQLLQFVREFQDIYGVDEVVCNFHCLVHYVDNVRELGPLWAHSCFHFEDLNGQLMKLVHGTNGIVEQLMRAVSIIQKFPQVTRECFQEGSPARDFFHKIWKQGDPGEKSNYHKIAESCFAIGYLKRDTKDGRGLLKNAHYDAIMQATRQPLGDLCTYDRMMIHGTMYHSRAYTRVYRHNSYTVLFGEDRHVGEILCFVQHVSTSCPFVDPNQSAQTARHYAIVHILPAILPSEVHNDITLHSVPHIKKHETSDRFVAVALDKIISKVVSISIGNCTYTAELPNNVEKE
ncbi:Hypp3965 [Branchiostoma lanceolatum]|uniref:Hypp3965 protein n=1 Tax=Branchiostoma lanceolatum TaxID=7740 RepID=A0A8K0EUS3_BRALA|nr:Hypp3965 [Branchiostoma lanceolatum]